MQSASQETRTVAFSAAGLDKITVARPGLLALPKGRLVLSLDLAGPGLKNRPGKKGRDAVSGHLVQSCLLTSDDGGATWDERASLPFGHCRLFRDGAGTYALGHAGNLSIGHSSDGGISWKTRDLTTAGGSRNRFVLGPANVLVENGAITTALTVRTDPDCKGNPASVHAIVLARAATGSDLENPHSWSFSADETAFRDLVPENCGSGSGIPFYAVPKPDRGVDLARNRWANRIGWTEAHVARVRDENHAWHGEGALHLLTGLYSHRANFGGLLRADGLDLSLQAAPTGAPMPFLPLPGGHQKFDLLYDEPSGLHWLAGTLPGDSMTGVQALPADRPGLPVDERRRLGLHFSRNLVDWFFAGVICEEVLVCEPALAVHGDALHLAAAAVPTDPKRPARTLDIAHFTIADFRSLAY